MKFLSVFIFTAANLLTFSIYAQGKGASVNDSINNNRKQEHYKSILKKGTPVGGYLSISPGVPIIDNNAGISAGAEIGMIFNHRLNIGLAAYVAASDKIQSETNMHHFYSLDYGGLSFEYLVNGTQMVHVGIPLLIGIGDSFLDNYNDNNNYDQSYEDTYVIAEPGLEAELNFTRYFKIGIRGTYRFTNKVYTESGPNINTDGFNASISFKFGWF